MAGTVDDLLTAVRREAYLPDAHDLGPSDLLAIADEECAGILAELWKTAREEYGVTSEDVALVPGVTRYRIPRRALSRGVRGVSYVDAQGHETPATELPAMEAWRYQAASAARLLYTFEGDHIVIIGDALGGALRVRYHMRPSRMVETADAARILSATSTTLELDTGATIPSAITSTGALVDIVRGDSPYPVLYADRVVSGYGAPTLTLTEDIDASEIAASSAAGARRDYVCPRDCTVYPPLPLELHPVLVSATVRRVTELLGDTAAMQAAEATMQRRRSAAVALLEPRNADRKPAIIARGGALRGRGRSRGWSR